jgi:serine/threonine protein kinase
MHRDVKPHNVMIDHEKRKASHTAKDKACIWLTKHSYG